MYYTIYKIINNIDGREYIGQHKTKKLDDDYMGSGKHLISAQKFHGIENFSKEILFIFDNEHEMDAKEAELVTEEYCKRDDTYNIAPGGFGGGYRYLNLSGLNLYGKNRENAIKALAKGTQTQKQLRENDSEWVENHSKSTSDGLKSYHDGGGKNGFAGKSHSKETKTKLRMSKGNGSENSQFGTMWITDGTINKKIKRVDIIPEGWYNGRKINK
jgi:hypothetical protein